MRSAYLFFLILLFSACTTPEKAPEETIEVPQEVTTKPSKSARISVDIPDYQFFFSSLALNQHMRDMDYRVFKHYGEFYTEDFNIFRLDRVDYLAESYFIDDINLYFIDSLLVKIQAYLKEDKSQEFLRKYGNAKILVNDYHNKKLLETEKVLIQKNGKLRINEKLDAYKLKWDRMELDIEYAVNKKPDSTMIIKSSDIRLFDDKRHRYKLTFQTKDYDRQLAWVKWESYKQSRGLVTESVSDQ